MGHRSDEITSYLSDTLEPEARASFEAHLATCQECQEELAAQRALFAQVNQALAFKPKRTIDEQVARFEQQVAAERAAHRPRPRRAWRLPAGALALAAGAAAVFLMLRQPAGPAPGPGMMAGADAGHVAGMVAAPHPPPAIVDGGTDGGVTAP
jgi:anti-sigma factor RsiW